MGLRNALFSLRASDTLQQQKLPDHSHYTSPHSVAALFTLGSGNGHTAATEAEASHVTHQNHVQGLHAECAFTLRSGDGHPSATEAAEQLVVTSPHSSSWAVRKLRFLPWDPGMDTLWQQHRQMLLDNSRDSPDSCPGTVGCGFYAETWGWTHGGAAATPECWALKPTNQMKEN